MRLFSMIPVGGRFRSLTRGTAAALAIGALTACSSVDADQARICRLALPAVVPDFAGFEVAAIRPGSESGSVRVVYRRKNTGPGAREHAVTCRFAAEGLSAAKAELVALDTETGRLSPASVHLLKTFYLNSPEALAADPGPGDVNAGLPVLPPGPAYTLQQALVGLPAAAIYGLLAAAYALVFRLAGRINLAFGEIAAIGAAAAGLSVAAYAGAGLASPFPGLAFAIAVAIGAAALGGAVAGHAAFVLVPATRTQASLIATVGLSIAIMEYLRLAGGSPPAWIPVIGDEPWGLARSGEFIVAVTPVGIGTAATGFAAGAGLIALMQTSRVGREWRAASDDGLAAALFGVDLSRLTTKILALSGAAAGLAGALVAIQFGALGFAGGFQLGLKALAASLLGGAGSLAGGFAGGLAIGLFETLWSAFLPIEGRDLALNAMLIVTIVLRPNGLFGSAPRQAPT